MLDKIELPIDTLRQQGFSEIYLKKVTKYLTLEKPKQNDFYRNELFTMVNDIMKENISLQIRKGKLQTYTYMISTVGFSPDPIALVLNAFRPEFVFFIVTPESRKTLAVLQQLVDLKWGQFEIISIEDESSENIYEEVKKIISRPEVQHKIDKTALDITGGKKSMAANLAIAGTYANIDILYVDHDLYIDSMNKPFPGTEKILKLENPLNVFGDYQAEKGIEKFNRFDFPGASAIFSELMTEVRDPRKYEVLLEISDAFNSYDNFDFKQAYKLLTKVKEEMEHKKLVPSLLPSVKNHLNLLNTLKDLQLVYKQGKLNGTLSDPARTWAVIANFWQCAQRRRIQGRNDMAALLFYRIFELIIQRRLVLLHINAAHVNLHHLFVNSKTLIFPSYINENLPLNKEKLVQEINEINEKLYKATYRPLRNLPGRFTLMIGMTFLHVLKDPVFKDLNLSQVLFQVNKRNQSILAHGIKILTETEAEDFEKTIWSILTKAWESETHTGFHQGDLKSYLLQFQFPEMEKKIILK